jgi:general stress protein 26
MARPRPEAVDLKDLEQLARETMARAKFPMLATEAGGQARVRPVSPVRTDGFTVFIANLREYGKTAEIAANPRVELAYLDDRHDQVRITGIAEVLEEASVREAIWNANPLLRSYLGEIDNPQLIIYRIVPKRVRFMREWALEYFEVPLVQGAPGDGR